MEPNVSAPIDLNEGALEYQRRCRLGIASTKYSDVHNVYLNYKPCPCCDTKKSTKFIAEFATEALARAYINLVNQQKEIK